MMECTFVYPENPGKSEKSEWRKGHGVKTLTV